ncbi:putative cleavage and polyadenylation specificity factor subunit 2 [Babesia caballi]|uniref:Cleavage and polyadenylation specificity factor subunit 2 n=1 Tax=Babesia caballi TaxID=5871 RepID=A0AAV4LYL5_BABCB|nr:probable cleavage and polyadenylation specificity factor subunit 2 [Babesia caballi]
MACVLAEPLIYGSLRATKVTLRFPASLFDRKESTGNDPVVKSEDASSPTPSPSEPRTTRSTRSSSRGASTRSIPSRSNTADEPSGGDAAGPPADEFFDFTVLLNCGWSLDLEREGIELLKQHAADVDVIAITDGDFYHVGALPVVYSWLRDLRGDAGAPPVLCTEASYKLARACLVDVLENATFSYKFEDYSNSDLEFLYAGCRKLRYREGVLFTKTLGSASVQVAFTPLNNGTSIGGAAWKLSVGARSVFLCPTYCVTSAWYLNGCDLPALSPADVFVTYQQPCLPDAPTPPMPWECTTIRDILSVVAGTLRSQGSVLIPMDVNSHVIDLLLHLNAVWHNCNLQQFPIVLVSPIASKLVLMFATCLEYMRYGICHSFLRSMWNPVFNMKFIHPVSTLEELRKFTNIPCVFVSTCSSLSFGVTSYLFAALCSYYRNSVIFTRESAEVSQLLLQQRDARQRRDSGGLRHDFTLRLNLEHHEDPEDPELDSLPGSIPSPRASEPPPEDVAMDSLGDRLSSDFLFTNNRNFDVHNGFVSYAPATIMRDDVDNRDKRGHDNLDYGIPYDHISAADLDHTLAVPSGFGHQEERPHQPEAYSEPEDNPLQAYYVQHLGGHGATDMFEGQSAPAPQAPPGASSRLVSKSLPLVIHSGLYITRYFQHRAPRCELAPLLREVRPRSIALLSQSDDEELLKLEQTVRAAVPNCGTFYYAQATQDRDSPSSPASSPRRPRQVSIPLDLRQELVSRSAPLLLQSRAICRQAAPRRKAIPKRSAVTPRISRMLGVLASIDGWKRLHNPPRLYQAMVRFNSNGAAAASAGAGAFRAFAFWHERQTRPPPLSLSTPYEPAPAAPAALPTDGADQDTDVDAPTALTLKVSDGFGDSDAMRHSLGRSLYTGGVGVPTLVRYLDECVPDGCFLAGGVVNVNGGAQVLRRDERYGVSRWVVRGTLDPAFYLARKLLRKLHNRIEPLY